jgi:metal-sulfur cluster biosynthetic enzyme/Fe-S cluster assembly iron-binding protein IscA
MPPAKSPAVDTGSAADTVRLRLTPDARSALSAALVGRPKGSGIRIWVERGMRPHAQMMIDLPSHRDVPVEVEGVPLLLDENSLRFLRDAEVRYRTDQNPPGFEVVGPFLPASTETSESAPAATSAPPTAPAKTGTGKGRPEVEERIRQALKNVYDPEIPLNVVDLGLIYGMDWSDAGELTIRMTLTSPGCPAVEAFTEEVERTAREASGLPRVKVEIVWEPPWGPDRMSDFARRQFGYA